MLIVTVLTEPITLTSIAPLNWQYFIGGKLMIEDFLQCYTRPDQRRLDECPFAELNL